ncbi:MAG: alkaline phosphatase family protein [Candidatus Aminicenantes bacterium]|nr:alkaline phosphatase family protein [Candidatus Aminicenantes bacterium]
MTDPFKPRTDSPIVDAVRNAYRLGQEDEALEPIIAVDEKDQPIGRFQDGDYVIFYDIRGEREIEITQSLIDKDFSHFHAEKNLHPHFVTMIEYSSKLDVKVAFPPEEKIRNTLTEVLSRQGFRSAKIAESEKAVHVGYFMNGKRENPFPNEERIVVPSPEGIDSYALCPEMSVSQVSQEIINKLQDPSCRVIIANFANVDVVGHIENEAAVKKAVEAVDRELKRVFDSCLKEKVTMLVTADHGTVEQWFYPDGAIDTGHTRNPVPFIVIDPSAKGSGKYILREGGSLIDIAPTVLELLDLQKPEEMNGESLLRSVPEEIEQERRILLLILDGWGIRDEKEGNLIMAAHTPNFDILWNEYPHTLLEASGEAVGMPAGSVGNSEAGHLHIGAGRRIYLDRVKIDRSIEDGSFYQNDAFLWAMENAKKEDKSLHLLGIVSFYSSHGSINHLFALIRLAEQIGVSKVFIHALLGRRGEKPESGAIYVDKVVKMCEEIGIGKVVTIIGRFWALDREDNWDRIEKTYSALVYGTGSHVINP